MKKKIYLATLLTIITVGLYSYRSAGNISPKQTLEEELCKGIAQHFDEMNHDNEKDIFFFHQLTNIKIIANN